MKKFILFAACIAFATAFSFAQDYPNYGIISQQEFDFKQCEFDKEATAVVLLHEAYSDYDDEHHLITTHHVRIKILKEQGFDWASVSIPYYRKDDFERIDNIEGITINVDNGQEVQTKLERKAVFTQKTNERIGQVIFTFPAIKAGSIVEYKYRSVMKHYGGLEDWQFQEELPVIMSKYNLVILPNAEFAYRVNKTLNIPLTIKKESYKGGVYFEMQNIPGLRNEPYMDARKDYLQRVIFQLSGYGMGGDNRKKYMTSWEDAIRELNNTTEFGTQLNKNIAAADQFIALVKSLPLPEDKMKAVYQYVRSNMNWNNMYSKYSESVKDAWQKQQGTSGDVNLILVNLLKEAGLDAFPMLVSERFHGKVDVAYPFIDQFNSVFACVVINNRKYYLDATDKTIPAQLTPSTILNTTGFIVNRKAGGLLPIVNDSARYKEYIIAQLDMAADGSLSGEVMIKSVDYARIKKLENYKADKEKFLRENFILDGTSVAGTNLEVTNIDNDSLSLDQHCMLSGHLNTAGEFLFFPINSFTGFYNNPFISENRLSNVNFGYSRNINVNMTLQLPPDYVIDDLPKAVKVTDPDKDIVFIRQIVYDKETNLLRCMVQLDFKKSLYEADMYPVLREFYKKIFEYLKEPVVIKKK